MKLFLWQLERFAIRTSRVLFGAALGAGALYCFSEARDISDILFSELTLGLLFNFLLFSLGSPGLLALAFWSAFGSGPSSEAMAKRGVLKTVEDERGKNPVREKHFYEKEIGFPLWPVLLAPVMLFASIGGFFEAWQKLDSGVDVLAPLSGSVVFLIAAMYLIRSSKIGITKNKKK